MLKKVFLGGLVLCLAAVLAFVYLVLIRPNTLPVYQMGSYPSVQKDFTANTLTRRDTVYASDAAELPLEMTEFGFKWTTMIGKTDQGLEIYAIPHQDSHNYVMMTTEMFPNVIYRNTQVPPVQLENFKADELLLIEVIKGYPAQKKNSDQIVIREVIDALTQSNHVTRGFTLNKSGNVELLSKQLPGLAYAFYVSTDTAGNVFLATRLAPDDWIPAGPAFSAWFTSLQ
jgi:hypothetical protein